MPAFKSYLIGFLCSICLTLLAFFTVLNHWAGGAMLIGMIFALALIQLVVQLIYFLHLGGRASRWKLAVFAAAIGMIFLIIAGSLWIMEKLNYNMTPNQVNQYMLDQGSF